MHEASIALQREQFNSAKLLLNNILKIDPRHALALTQLAIISQKMGENQKAQEYFKKALLYSPDHSDIRNAYGAFLFSIDNYTDAKIEFEKANRQSKNARQTMLNLAATLSRLANYNEAEAIYETLITRDDKDIEAYRGKLEIYEKTKNIKSADQIINRFLIVEPKNIEFNLRLGVLNAELSKYKEAIEIFNYVIDLDSRNQIAFFNKATILKKANQTNEAIDTYKHYESLFGSTFDLNYNLANAYDDLGDFQNAVSRYEACLEINKTNADTFQNLAEALSNMGEFQRAVTVYRESMVHFPLSSSLKFGFSLLNLKLKNFDEGWKHYEERWNDPEKQEKFQNFKPHFTDVLNEEQFRNRSILLLSEQGVGDVIMFLSSLDDLMIYSKNITVLTFDRIIKLLSNSFPTLKFLPIDKCTLDLIKSYEIFIPCGRLPTIFRKTHESFPGRPYLVATSEACNRFNELLKPHQDKIKIGISWRGGTVETRTRHRSLSIKELQPLFSLSGCQFVSLQYALTETEKQEFDLNQINNLTIFDSNITNDLDDLAGLITNLDFVVTVQNTNVHLAGALGKKCFTILPMSPEWRYGSSGRSMVWYNSVELFRQEQHGIWQSVIDEVVKRVEDYCNEFRVGRKNGTNT